MTGKRDGDSQKPPDKEKMRAAAEAASRRSSKKGKGMLKYYIAGTATVVGLLSMIVVPYFDAQSSNKGARGSRGRDPGDSKMTKLVNDKSFVYSITGNAAGNFTAAASPFFDGWTYGDVAYGLGGVGLYGETMIGMPGALQACEKDEGIEGGTLPPSYDARENWPTCMPKIIDSGNCSSSYAIAAASAMSARFCIADEGEYKSLALSAQQILSCDKKSRGCKGGGADSVFGYLQTRGLYPEECVPYGKGEKVACKTSCDEGKKLRAIHHCVLSSEKAIKREIINNGPVVAPMYVKDDFLVYEQGVYTPTDTAKQLSNAKGSPMLQAVTLLGWGRSEGTKYWIVGNSWGEKWGEKGYARVAIDTAIRESYALAVYPATKQALEAEEKKKEESKKRLEEAKKERAAREERIREARMKAEEEQRLAKEAADDADLDSEDWEDEIEDLDSAESKAPVEPEEPE